jgi:transcriptional regulator with XRE-family HTH domain
MGEQEQDRAEAARWTDFGQWLAQLRRDRGLTQQAVARKTSVSVQNLVVLEHGGHRRYADGPWVLPNPRDDTLEALARMYEVDAGDMFQRVGRYDDRPQTRSSMRGVSRRRVERSDRLAELEARIEALERRDDELVAQQQRAKVFLREHGIGQSPAVERSRRRRDPAAVHDRWQEPTPSRKAATAAGDRDALRGRLLGEAETTEDPARAAELREQAESLTRPGSLAIAGTQASADPEQRRAANQARLAALRAGLADGKTPEQLGLRRLDPERIAEQRRHGAG